MDWLTDYKLPIGKVAETVFGSLKNIGAFFDILADSLEAIVDAVLWILQTPHPLVVVVAIVALTAWWHKQWQRVALVSFSLLFAINQGYWKETTDTLALVLAAAGTCMVIGVPLGIAAAHRPWLYTALRPVLDLMQTIPPFVYLIPGMVLFGIGVVPALLATVIFVLPAPIRLTYLGVSSTPKALLEAGDAFGCSPKQLLFKVELPYAMPQIMAGMTQAIMLSLSMVVIAALVGAAGLGVPVVRALSQVNIAKGFEAGLVIVLIAIMLDRIFRVRGGD